MPTVAADGSIYVAYEKANASQFSDDYYLARGHYMVVKVNPATGLPLGAPVEVGLVYDGPNDYPNSSRGRLTYQDSQFRTNSCGNISADPTNAQHLAIVWSDMRNNPYPDAELPSSDPYAVVTNSDIIVSQSFDGGQTWSPPTAIEAPGDQFQPFTAYNSSGQLQIGYYDRSYDPANHKYGYTLASETFSGSLEFTFQQVTTALSDPTRDFAWGSTTVNPDFPSPATFLGDYSSIAIVPGTNQVAGLWTDMREQTAAGASLQDAYFALMVTPEALNAAAVISRNSSKQIFQQAAVEPNAGSEADWLIAINDFFTESSLKRRK